MYQIALYFQFISHYTKWLGLLSVAGIITALDVYVQAGVDKSYNEALLSSYLIPFFCVFVSFWAQFMIEFWKRTQITKSVNKIHT